MLSSLARGLRFMSSPSAFSMPRARPGSVSVIMLIHSSWTEVRMVKFRMEAKKMISTSARLVESWNCTTFMMLS